MLNVLIQILAMAILVMIGIFFVGVPLMNQKIQIKRRDNLLKEGNGQNGWKWFGPDRDVRISYPYQVLEMSEDYISRIECPYSMPPSNREVLFHGLQKHPFKEEWHKAHLTVEVINNPPHSLDEFEVRGNTLIGVIPYRKLGHNCHWRVWLKDHKVDMNDIDIKWIPIEDPEFLNIIFPPS